MHAASPHAFDLPLPDGGRVSALVVQPSEMDSALVLAHGAGAGMTHAFLHAVAEGLAARRVATLRYQFPYMEAGRRRVDTPVRAHEAVRAAAAHGRALWPDRPLFAGGKSFGGRMTSQAQSIAPLPGVVGLVFLGFPLHPAGTPSLERANHLEGVHVPMLFVRGTRDALAQPRPFQVALKRLGMLAQCVDVVDADHGFDVPRRAGRPADEVLAGWLDAVVMWTHAWRLRPRMRRR